MAKGTPVPRQPKRVPLPITPDNILGILSLVFWTLVIVVSIKYVAFIMRADNHGEGGILALLALVTDQGRNPKTRGETGATPVFSQGWHWALPDPFEKKIVVTGQGFWSMIRRLSTNSVVS